MVPILNHKTIFLSYPKDLAFGKTLPRKEYSYFLKSMSLAFCCCLFFFRFIIKYGLFQGSHINISLSYYSIFERPHPLPRLQLPPIWNSHTLYGDVSVIIGVHIQWSYIRMELKDCYCLVTSYSSQGPRAIHYPHVCGDNTLPVIKSKAHTIMYRHDSW